MMQSRLIMPVKWKFCDWNCAIIDMASQFGEI